MTPKVESEHLHKPLVSVDNTNLYLVSTVPVGRVFTKCYRSLPIYDSCHIGKEEFISHGLLLPQDQG